MLAAGSFTFGILFWTMGHTLALDFLVNENPGGRSSFLQCIFPWPKRGKFVSYISMALALIFFFIMAVYLPGVKGFDVTTIKLLTPGVFITICYAHYLFKRLQRHEGRCFFVHILYLPEEWTLPVVLFVSASIFMFVLHFF
jgi:hypothetical protein